MDAFQSFKYIFDILCNMRFIVPYKALSDERGNLIEIVKSKNWKQMNYSFTKEGSIRGNHYHKTIEELFYILKGEVKIEIHNLKTGMKETNIVKGGQGFIIELYEIHRVTALTDVEWIVLYSDVFDQTNPDIFRVDGD